MTHPVQGELTFLCKEVPGEIQRRENNGVEQNQSWTLNIILNRKPASRNDNPLPQDWVHMAVSFTPTSTGCHSHCPVELRVKGLQLQSSYMNSLCQSTAEPGLGRGGIPWWQRSARNVLSCLDSLLPQDTLTLFPFQVFVLKTTQTEIYYSWCLALSQACQGKCRCLSEPGMWAGDWIQKLFFRFSIGTFLFCPYDKFFRLWIDQVNLSPREKFTVG